MSDLTIASKGSPQGAIQTTEVAQAARPAHPLTEADLKTLSAQTVFSDLAIKGDHKTALRKAPDVVGVKDAQSVNDHISRIIADAEKNRQEYHAFYHRMVKKNLLGAATPGQPIEKQDSTHPTPGDFNDSAALYRLRAESHQIKAARTTDTTEKQRQESLANVVADFAEKLDRQGFSSRRWEQIDEARLTAHIGQLPETQEKKATAEEQQPLSTS